MLGSSYLVRKERLIMAIVTVSEKGQVVIPAEIRKRLGIQPGCQLNFTLEGDGIRIEIQRSVPTSQAEEGYGMLVCHQPGKRRLADFDVAQAMQQSNDDCR